ncbi:MAG: F0F1 ATP synthase subunit delta, partial [Nitrococcus mobilis]|nr:F0F1 ATP synthase subunit delta [Nitrococcus mobilis]
REQARAQLAEEIVAERKRQLANLKTELDTEHQKAAAVAMREAEATRRQQEQTARELAGAFASRLLTRLASPELERSLIAMALKDLEKLDSVCHARLREATGPVEAITAFALPVSEQAALQRAVESELGEKGEWRFTQQPELVAGLRLRIGAWVLQANLHDELAFFH